MTLPTRHREQIKLPRCLPEIEVRGLGRGEGFDRITSERGERDRDRDRSGRGRRTSRSELLFNFHISRLKFRNWLHH